MKYNININQKSVCDAGLIGKVDLVDLALFDFIYNFFNSEFDGKITFFKDGVQYVEITASLVNSQMPLIQMKKRCFIYRMNNLIDLGLIGRYEGNQKEGRSAFRKGANWDKLSIKPPTQNLAHPTQENAEGYATNCTPPTQNLAHNNTIDNNNIINNKEKEKEKVSVPLAEMPLAECRDILMSNEIWKETVVMNLRSGGLPAFSEDELNSNLDFFFKKLANEGVTEKSPKDAMAHFSRWLNIELKNAANQKHRPSKQEANAYAMQQFINYCNTPDSGVSDRDKPF